MRESFLHLSAPERAEIIRACSSRLGQAPRVLEKDFWVCWTLRQLFLMPRRKPMAFKGGTSLSKVYQAIDRFSEDIDITIDFRGFETGIDPFAPGISRSQRDRLSKQLKNMLRQYSRDSVVPYCTQRIAQELSTAYRVEVSEDGEKLRFHYPSVLDGTDVYLGDSVLIEFGGRNITEPNEEHKIAPEIAALVPELDFPVADVTVLAPARTFWEKATLIHVECQRQDWRSGADRLSRHWYDLTMLAGHAIGSQALANRELLADVVRHKKVFFNSAESNYDLCLSGKLCLVPKGDLLQELKRDYNAMIAAGMFYRDYPKFDDMIQRLGLLESAINTVAS